jgi:hypothetical protein
MRRQLKMSSNSLAAAGTAAWIFGQFRADVPSAAKQARHLHFETQ